VTRLRVLALHAGDERYGSDRVFEDVVVGLDRDRFEPVVVLPRDVPGGGELGRRLCEAGLEVHRRDLAVLRRRYLAPAGLPVLATRLARDAVQLSLLAGRLRCDLVYTNTAAVLGGGLAARRSGRPHVWHVHEIVESPRPVSRLLRASIAHLSTEVIAVSQAVARWIGPLERPLTVLHNGVGERRATPAGRAAMRERLLAGRAGPLVGWVSRVSSWKGQERFVDMAERVVAARPDAVFVLAGGAVPGHGTLVDALHRRIAGSAYRDRIRYLGEVPDGPALVGALDVLVACPTRPDPLPRVVAESLWQGVPVLGVRTGGIPELVEDGRTGRLVASAEPADLAAGLLELLEPGTLASMSRRAAQVGDRFAVAPFVERVGAILDRAAWSAGPARGREDG
jgi:glycosyltransferase involved in cell wall biosynthesis